MGLERALMIRKRIPDIRYLRSADPRIAAQLQDLDPWRPVSMLPATTRDLSVVLDEATDDETLGDTVRTALEDRIADVESIEVLTRTPHDRLPQPARRRLGIRPGQVNALVRLTLRPLERTLTSERANQIRNDVYVALHTGPHHELA
jgi:phenylalanyl-tRNA synthetase alpha chain